MVMFRKSLEPNLFNEWIATKITWKTEAKIEGKIKKVREREREKKRISEKIISNHNIIRSNEETPKFLHTFKAEDRAIIINFLLRFGRRWLCRLSAVGVLRKSFC